MRELRAYAQLRDLHGPEPAPVLGDRVSGTAMSEANNRLNLRSARQVVGLACVEPQNGEPSDPCAANHDIATISQALSELPPDCLAAFRLVRLEGLSYEEAAQRLHLRPYQVRRHVAHALACCLTAVESGTREGSI